MLDKARHSFLDNYGAYAAYVFALEIVAERLVKANDIVVFKLVSEEVAPFLAQE